MDGLEWMVLNLEEAWIGSGHVKDFHVCIFWLHCMASRGIPKFLMGTAT